MSGPSADQHELLAKPGTSSRPFVDEESVSPLSRRVPQRVLYIGQIVLFTVILGQFLIMTYRNYVWAAATGLLGGVLPDRAPGGGLYSNVPDYYQTTPELFPGTFPILDI